LFPDKKEYEPDMTTKIRKRGGSQTLKWKTTLKTEEKGNESKKERTYESECKERTGKKGSKGVKKIQYRISILKRKGSKRKGEKKASRGQNVKGAIKVRKFPTWGFKTTKKEL